MGAFHPFWVKEEALAVVEVVEIGILWVSEITNGKVKGMSHTCDISSLILSSSFSSSSTPCVINWVWLVKHFSGSNSISVACLSEFPSVTIELFPWTKTSWLCRAASVCLRTLVVHAVSPIPLDYHKFADDQQLIASFDPTVAGKLDLENNMDRT